MRATDRKPNVSRGKREVKIYDNNQICSITLFQLENDWIYGDGFLQTFHVGQTFVNILKS